MKIFDVHIHIYPEKIALKASQSIGEFYGGEQVHGTGTLEDCVSRLDAAGIACFAAHSVALQPRNVEAINRFILSARDRYPQRIVPFAALHPDIENLPAAVEDMAARGFRGFKVHPDMQRFEVDSDRAAPMMEAVAATGLPLLIHCGDYRYDYDGPKRILALKRRLSSLQIICAHLGGWSQWDDAAACLPGNGLFVDLSSSLYQLAPDRAAEIIRRFGTENVLYGTDYPMWDPEEELQRFLRLPLTDAERADIFWNNADRLFKLDTIPS